MKTIIPSNRFKKDVKMSVRRGYDLSLLEKIIEKIALDVSLEVKHQNHRLVGNYAGFLECHIKPDWLLIYKLDEENLYLVRTGSHSDLYG